LVEALRGEITFRDLASGSKQKAWLLENWSAELRYCPELVCEDAEKVVAAARQIMGSLEKRLRRRMGSRQGRRLRAWGGKG
jgi:hypothetical protein